MKKILYTLCIASTLLLAGCDDFLDVNTSKDSPITITVDQAIELARTEVPVRWREAVIALLEADKED